MRDVSELLDELGPVATRHPLPVTVAYHDACHLATRRACARQPRDLLRGIPGLELREVADADICCGSAGIYNLLNPEAAGELGDRKARAVLATGAELLVTANPGCLMQVASSVASATPAPGRSTSPTPSRCSTRRCAGDPRWPVHTPCPRPPRPRRVRPHGTR